MPNFGENKSGCWINIWSRYNYVAAFLSVCRKVSEQVWYHISESFNNLFGKNAFTITLLAKF